ncbi:hypothetical protein HW511_07585 [Asaia siamensis]|uniref:Uncharacterized protein n=1 Tax=Asaia siamensis TaxID=110479 RepID=A0ABQ1LQS1_9PROT|nr:hypothetical protein [Asaia siamensis]GBR04288.1 hypothetical protein AA0323_0654 [Asaia siamensis NRIC 0323]GGC28289.1 hypothetical protein GCM10007207_12150 [Asaia siamensis]
MGRFQLVVTGTGKYGVQSKLATLSVVEVAVGAPKCNDWQKPILTITHSRPCTVTVVPCGVHDMMDPDTV